MENLLTVEELKEQLKKHGFIAILWSVNDVIYRANDEHNINPSLEQATQILENIQRLHDADLGVSWLTIDNAIQEYFN